jgi:hypothetical protein
VERCEIAAVLEGVGDAGELVACEAENHEGSAGACM